MKHELELKVQAWVDGELSDREAAQIAEWVARDAAAGVLARELGSVSKSMAANEPAVTVPESREFYWSKVARQIQREESAAQRSPVSWLARWRRLVIPLAGVSALAVLTLTVNQMRRPTFDEISATDQGMDAVTFHDQSDGMTVVWLQDSSQPLAPAQPAKVSIPDEPNSDFDTE